LIRFLARLFARREYVSNSWLKELDRKESCEGWADYTWRIWLKSEKEEKRKTEMRRRLLIWKENREKKEA
jgi:hypothetical protein